MMDFFFFFLINAERCQSSWLSSQVAKVHSFLQLCSLVSEFCLKRCWLSAGRNDLKTNEFTLHVRTITSVCKYSHYLIFSYKTSQSAEETWNMLIKILELCTLFHQRFVIKNNVPVGFWGDTEKVHVFAGKPSTMLAAGASISILTWVRPASPDQELKLSRAFQILSIQHLRLTLGLTTGRFFLDGVCNKPSVCL